MIVGTIKIAGGQNHTNGHSRIKNLEIHYLIKVTKSFLLDYLFERINCVKRDESQNE